MKTEKRGSQALLDLMEDAYRSSGADQGRFEATHPNHSHTFSFEQWLKNRIRDGQIKVEVL